MSIAGVSLGIIGYAINAASAKEVGAAPVRAVAGVQSCNCGRSDCPICGEASAKIEDTLELSPIAREELSADVQEALTEEELAQIEELEQRDQEVRAHEQAHLSAGGAYVSGGASYEYQTGPDGERYAIGGEVQIDVSPIKGDPEATIQKMRQVRAAALAPASPSARDRAVAAQAAAAIQEARVEMSRRTPEAGDEPDDTGGEDGAAALADQAALDRRFQTNLTPEATLVDAYA